MDLIGALTALATRTPRVVDVDPAHRVAIKNEMSMMGQDTDDAEKMIVKNAVEMNLAAVTIRKNVEQRTMDLAAIRIKMKIQCLYKGLF